MFSFSTFFSESFLSFLERILGDRFDDLFGGGDDGADDDAGGDAPEDDLAGTEGNDRLDAFGEDDDVTIDGFGGRDTIDGGDGDDVLRGGADRDNIGGGRGDDLIEGGDGDDFVLTGDAGDDTIDGGAGDDEISGNTGNDELIGGTGDDDLDGDDGDDLLEGGTGDDRLIGKAGTDTLTGGAGSDEIVYFENDLNRLDPDPATRQVVNGGTEDRITDFEQGRGGDVFELDAENFGVFGELSVVNALAEDLPAGGVNVIALQNADDDGDPATVFNAGSAANLIAEQVEEDGAGFFVYFNSALELNRLVYSDNLADATADLKILNRLTDETGDAAIEGLGQFTADNFTFFNEQPSLEELEADGEIILAEAGVAETFTFEGDFVELGAAGFDADQDLGYVPEERAEIIGFDPAEDTLAVDGSTVGEGVDSLVFDGADQNVFFFTFEGTGVSDDRALAAVIDEAEAGNADADAGFFVYYDGPEDVVKVGAYENARDQDVFLEAGTITEIEVEGQAEANALIGQLSAENFELIG